MPCLQELWLIRGSYKITSNNRKVVHCIFRMGFSSAKFMAIKFVVMDLVYSFRLSVLVYLELISAVTLLLYKLG